jgi:hypothetical protein
VNYHRYCIGLIRRIGSLLGSKLCQELEDVQDRLILSETRVLHLRQENNTLRNRLHNAEVEVSMYRQMDSEGW